MNRDDDLKKQAINLIKKTVTQLEDLSRVFIKPATMDRIKSDTKNMIEERDELFKKFGEECDRLIENEKLPVPKPVKKLYKSIRSAVDDLMDSSQKDTSASGCGETAAAAPAARKPHRSSTSAKKRKKPRAKKTPAA